MRVATGVEGTYQGPITRDVAGFPQVDSNRILRFAEELHDAHDFQGFSVRNSMLPLGHRELHSNRPALAAGV
ncbi:hypothetical protein ABIA30_003916 [Mycobacterium sp. MAA66]